MDTFQAIIIGLIQGLTEFLPISSSAHMRIIPSLLGWNDPGAGFTGIIQLGTFLSTLIYFRHEVIVLFSSWIKSIFTLGKHYTVYTKLSWSIIYGTFPIVIIGLLSKTYIENHLRSQYIVAASMIMLALFMQYTEKISKKKKDLKKISKRDGFIIGLFQCLALIPGSSRSGSTICAALLTGYNRETAATYSFLLSLPSVLGSGLYCIKNHSEDILQTSPMPLLAGTLTAGIVGYIMLDIFLGYLRKNSLRIFIWYRIILGILILWLLQLNIIPS